jgi:hypothetical protein
MRRASGDALIRPFRDAIAPLRRLLRALAAPARSASLFWALPGVVLRRRHAASGRPRLGADERHRLPHRHLALGDRDLEQDAAASASTSCVTLSVSSS